MDLQTAIHDSFTLFDLSATTNFAASTSFSGKVKQELERLKLCRSKSLERTGNKTSRYDRDIAALQQYIADQSEEKQLLRKQRNELISNVELERLNELELRRTWADAKETRIRSSNFDNAIVRYVEAGRYQSVVLNLVPVRKAWAMFAYTPHATTKDHETILDYLYKFHVQSLSLADQLNLAVTRKDINRIVKICRVAMEQAKHKSMSGELRFNQEQICHFAGFRKQNFYASVAPIYNTVLKEAEKLADMTLKSVARNLHKVDEEKKGKIASNRT